MIHLSITFLKDLKDVLDRKAKREKTKRSTLIQRAVRAYLRLKHQKSLQELLQEGYLEMTSESGKVMEDFKELDTESLKNGRKQRIPGQNQIF